MRNAEGGGRMAHRSLASYPKGVERAPVSVVDIVHGPTGAGLHWGALVFTALIAGAFMYGALNVADVTAFVSPRRTTVATAAPVPTAAPTAPAAQSLASAWVSQTAYPVISVGGTATIKVTFKNTGTATWVRGTPSEIRLGAVAGEWDPAMAVQWIAADRPAVQGEAQVAPGGTVSFTFQVKGVKPGVYKIGLRPVVDGVGWLNDEGVYVPVDVR